MRFAHISDFHFTDSASDFRHIRDDLLEALPKLFADLRSIEGYLDFIAITGDVVESGDIPSYLKVRESLDMFNVPVFLVPGNHDRRETFREVFSPSYHVPKSGPLDFNVDLGGAQIIGLEALSPRNPEAIHGALTMIYP